MGPTELSTRVIAPLDANALYDRVAQGIEPTLLELDVVVATCFDRALEDAEQQRAAGLVLTLSRCFGELELRPALELVPAVEDAIAHGDPGRASEALDGMRAVLAPALSITAGADGPVVVFSDDGSDRLDGALWAAAARGWRVALAAAGDAVEVAVDAVYVRPESSGPAELREQISALRARFAAPVVVHLDDDDLDVRAAIARSAELVLTNCGAQDAVNAVDELLRRRRRRPAIALFANAGERLSDALDANGIATERCTDIATLLDRVCSGNVDAVVVGDGDGVDQAVVVSLLHAEPRARGVGVIVLVGDDDPERFLDLLDAGADDVLPGDIDPAFAARWVRDRVQRLREHDAPRSGPSGYALAPAEGRRTVEQVLTSSLRSGASVSIALVVVEPDPSGSVPVATVADALAGQFRSDDVVARWSDDRIVVAVTGTTQRAAATRIDAALRAVGASAATYAGIVDAPNHGDDIDTLLAVAEPLIVMTRSADGPRVVSAGGADGAASRTDVLVIDPDATLRALIAGLFERHNLRVLQLGNGVSALEYVAKVGAAGLPRALVMELDLAGIEGLQFLRRLRELGVMDHTKILVVTARIREADLVEAIRLGAGDVVTKPFSPALLVHRLQRLIGS